MMFSVTILGSSAAFPTAHRFSTAQVLQTAGRFFLIDCGEGTQIQLRRFGISALRIHSIFISHLHGDHVFGLPGLISTMGMTGRTDTLHLYGPKELEGMLDSQLRFFNPPEFPLCFHVLTPNTSDAIYEDAHLTVCSFPLKHRIPTFGFRFQEKERPRNLKPGMKEFYQIPVRDLPDIKAGKDFITPEGKAIPNDYMTIPGIRSRSYAFCSDTVYTDTLIPYVKEVDVLYHEATYSQVRVDRAREMYHSTAEQAASIAKAAQVEKLVIGHFSAKYKDLDPLLQEAQAVFPNTVLAYDGLTLDIPAQR